MVAAVPSPAATSTSTPAYRSPKNYTHPLRLPLIPSAKDNAKEISSRRPRPKEISSRYLSSPSPSSSPSSTSASTSNSRRFPSPMLTPRPSTPSALPKQRSHSVDRPRPSTPQQASSNAAKALTTTTRSLSVSFQGESFFYQTSKAKASSSPNRNPNPSRRPTPERRRSAVLPAAPAPRDRSENSKPFERWPAARAIARQRPNPLSRSLDEKDPILATVRLLQQSSVVFEDGTRRISFDGASPLADSDTDSASSGSNSGASDTHVPLWGKVTSRGGINVPARVWQESNSRLGRVPEPCMRSVGSPKMSSVRRNLMDSPISSQRSSVGSPIRGPVRPSTPSRLAVSPSRGAASPLRTRGGVRMAGGVAASPGAQPGNAPSIISFAAEVRRAKKGENRIEEAHMLRLLHNRHLQWRCANARADAALDVQRLEAEKNLYNAWITISELRDSVTLKRIKLQLLTQNLKLMSILKGQMSYLEEWSHIDRDHTSSLSGAIEALKASTLRLPVVGEAKADLQEVKDAVGSAVDVMQAMGSSICSLLSKVEGTGSLVSEIAKVAAQERALLDQSRDLLSSIAAMHVKQCSLQSHFLQLKCRPSQMQV
ncbi:QWRF motif-containing protein 2-like [Iris pallida]|uniref:QWRF motif-containing protein 2-like n=1 Tax=Iris pallida TaxID=29817 RepID=A0AAX6FI83_IRIPA|nr:QWRF motif-containing protein 2-like [Iris pallida]